MLGISYILPFAAMMTAAILAGCSGHDSLSVEARLPSFQAQHRELKRKDIVDYFNLEKVESERALAGMRGGHHRLTEKWPLPQNKYLVGILLVPGEALPKEEDDVNYSGVYIDIPSYPPTKTEISAPEHFDALEIQNGSEQ